MTTITSTVFVLLAFNYGNVSYCFRSCQNGVPYRLDYTFFCDGSETCQYGEDENPDIYRESLCPGFRVNCRDDLQCIFKRKLCDGRFDCIDQSDEEPEFCEQYKCLGENLMKIRHFAWEYQCSEGYQKCADGKEYYPSEAICSGFTYCKDNSDNDRVMYSNMTCPKGHIKCRGGRQWIAEESMCGNFHLKYVNGICHDHTDRDTEYCKNWNCPSGYTKCRDGIECISLTKICDGYRQCVVGSDEEPEMCAGYECPQGYKCRGGRSCFNKYQACDGWHNCIEDDVALDEDTEFCKSFDCGPDGRKCADGLQCIKPDQWCHRYIQCVDKSDERAEMCT